MVIFSSMTKKSYLLSLRCKMSASSDLGQKRFTGFFLGSCFYVTHHAGFQWNRKITSQKNAAIGFVKDTENGCQVRFLTFRGIFCSLVFLPVFLVFLLMSQFMGAVNGAPMDVSLFLGLIIMAVYAPLATLFEVMTEESEEGHCLLLSLLHDPSARN